MANDPKSGPAGNRDNSKRGRDIPPGGRPGKGPAQTPSKGPGRSVDDPDTDGTSIGGSTR